MLFKKIARALVKQIGNAIGLGIAGDIAIDVWDSWSKEGQDQHQKLDEVQQLAQQSAGETRELAQAVALEVAGDQPEEVRVGIQTYLTQIPAMIRRSLRRPADPTGTTVPSGLAITKAEDLLTFLPIKPSRFKVGDAPLSGVDWELVELLGVGGFGEVWKARNPYFDGVPPVALKFCLDSEASRTLRYEAAVLNQVMRQGKHAGIVQLQHSYLSANPPCLEYEYIQGGDLTGLIRDWHRSGSCTAEQVACVMLQLAETVGFAHRLDPPIVHRDLKPANILLQQGQGGAVQLKVADFGIGGVAATQAIKESAKGLPAGMMMTAVATGTFTPLYASPQQMSGGKADPRDDVYALGIIWYQMLTGDLNAGRPGGARWRRKALERGMRPELVDLLETCFEDDPNDRPRDAADLIERLKPLLAPVAAPKPPAPPEKFPAVPPGILSLYLKAKGIVATGYEKENAFVVLAGSQAVKETVPSMGDGLVEKRNALIQQGILAAAKDCLILNSDCTFESPSMAAGVLLGRSANGRVEWKDSAGRTLKEIQAAAHPDPPGATARAKKEGLRKPHRQVLRTLAAATGPLSRRAIADKVGETDKLIEGRIASETLTYADLIEKGYAREKKTTVAGKAERVYEITEAGRAALAAAQQGETDFPTEPEDVQEMPRLPLPQARVLQALVPVAGEPSPLSRTELAQRMNVSPTSGTISVALSGRSDSPHKGLLDAGLVTKVKAEGNEDVYQITAEGITALKDYVKEHGELPPPRDPNLAVNNRFKK